MCETEDGFQLAEEDMKMRGPGDLEGTQQSGLPVSLNIASLAKDGRIIDHMETRLIGSASEAKPRCINIVSCVPDSIGLEPGKPTNDSAKAAIISLEKAVSDIKNGDIDVLVTAPINKRAMNVEGFGHTGHTEYLEKEFDVEEVLMFMVSDRLKVAVVTGHIPLKDVPGSITSESIVTKLRLMQSSLKRDFGVIEPKIAVLGLNISQAVKVDDPVIRILVHEQADNMASDETGSASDDD